MGMGFSAGVMIFISFMELLSGSIEKLAESYALSQARWMAIMAFFGGIAVALPIYNATGDRKKALLYTGLSGMATDELLPTANKYGDGHKEILGVVTGMFVMAISLLLLNGR